MAAPLPFPRYCRRYWLGGTEFGDHWLVWDGRVWWCRPPIGGIDSPEDYERWLRLDRLCERLDRLLPAPIGMPSS